MSEDVIVILTALELEYAAVREHLEDPRQHQHGQGTIFEVGRLRGQQGRIALAVVGKGNHRAAALAERAVQEFSPAAILFVGVAGALHSDLKLGDVVVASFVYGYHGGTSQNDGFKARPRAWEIPHAAEQAARHIAMAGGWAKTATTPKVHFGPIAAGEVVLDSIDSVHAQLVREHYNDALAIEMEGAGMAQAAHLNSALPAVVVRGLSDRADGTKTKTDRRQWQPKAAANAAAFAIALTRDLLKSRNGGRSTAENTARGAATVNGGTKNIAMGQARVGVQAGVVYGGINMANETRTTRSAAEELAALRSMLRHARESGELDQSTHDAAEAELEQVARSLNEKGSPRDRRAIVPLKRLRGLLLDLAEPAAKVTSLIAMVEGMA